MWTWTARVVALVCALLLLLPAAAGADPGNGQGKPGHGKPGNGPADGKPGKPGHAPGQASPADQKPEPEPIVGAPGTHQAHDTYGYPWPEAPDCDEGSVIAGCVNDGLGFFQGQCTSWVAFRLGQRNGLGFSNWYTGRHWGNASEWAKVAKDMGRKPDKIPAVGAVAWFKRGHVAYVEQVNTDGTIVISEMNFDGHNGFRLVTVAPGYGWPERFIHLADVAPTDVTPPTAPSGVTADRHVGGVRLQWEPSSDDLGVTGYRVSRNGVPLATATESSYWDEQVSPGQGYSYSVTAVDAAGNVSDPVSVTATVEETSVDRTWLTTAAGPALCGRSGSTEQSRIGCRVQTRRGWRYVGLKREAPWGRDGTRSFVPSADGGLAYCRRVGRDGHTRATCTELDVERLAWRRDQTSRRADLPLQADSSWVSTSAGPALCGRAGSQARQRVRCTVLTDAGWRSVVSDRETAWGHDGTRAFVANSYGGVSWCREVGPTARPGLACAPLVADTLTWGYDRISTASSPVQVVNRAWMDTGAGPALCGRTGSLDRQRVGCTVLTEAGWTHRATPARWGDPLSRALLSSGDDVSWCRVLDRGGARAACLRLDSDSLRWRPARTSRGLGSALADRGVWLASDTGPALCGRTGTPQQRRLGCAILSGRRWSVVSSKGEVSWGSVGGRAFLPGAGRARLLPQRGRARRRPPRRVHQPGHRTARRAEGRADRRRRVPPAPLDRLPGLVSPERARARPGRSRPPARGGSRPTRHGRTTGSGCPPRATGAPA